MPKPDIIVLSRQMPSAFYLLEQLNKVARVKVVVWEHSPARTKLRQLWRRAKKLGYTYPASRALLSLYCRIFERKQRASSPAWKLVEAARRRVPDNALELSTRSINAVEVVAALERTGHDVVVVLGTSIIQPWVLSKGKCFVNVHAGITPQYRGAHGAVWAVLNGDLRNAGVTVHFVDNGIDSGGILRQERIEVTRVDTMETLAAKQVVAGVRLLCGFLEETAPPHAAAPVVDKDGAPSRLYYSPTLGQYLRFKRIVARDGRESGSERD